MKNFDYLTQTRLIFGKGVVENKLLDVINNFGKNVLLTYGSGSIKKNGLYDLVKNILKDFNIYELSDIKPNPKYNPSVLNGVKICKENKIDVILSIGGGSVLDCSKAIAASSLYDGDPWDIITRKVETKGAIPIISIITLSATGSEFNGNAVISRTETNDKVGYSSRYVYPKVSFLDPTYTFSVSKIQTIAGAIDAMNHTIEQYFTKETTLLNDGFCEATIKSLMANLKIVLKEPNNYQARAEIMQAAAYACNGILSRGNSSSGWPCHAIEHALSAYYDITHGVGLAIITPRWMRHILNDESVDRFVKYGVNIFGISSNLEKYEIANKAIDMTYSFYESTGIPMHLKQLGIDESRIDEMTKHIVDNEGLDKAFIPLNFDDIKDILIKSL